MANQSASQGPWLGFRGSLPSEGFSRGGCKECCLPPDHHFRARSDNFRTSPRPKPFLVPHTRLDGPRGGERAARRSDRGARTPETLVYFLGFKISESLVPASLRHRIASECTPRDGDQRAVCVPRPPPTPQSHTPLTQHHRCFVPTSSLRRLHNPAFSPLFSGACIRALLKTKGPTPRGGGERGSSPTSSWEPASNLSFSQLRGTPLPPPASP